MLKPSNNAFEHILRFGLPSTSNILASRVCGARTLAFEPASETVVHLRRNIEVNALEHLVEVHQIVLGRVSADATFTVGRDTLNRVALLGEDLPLIALPMRRLDVPYASEATLIKLDVEGYEAEVLAGASRVLAARVYSPSKLRG